MTIIENRNTICYRPDKNKKLYFDNDDKRLYSEIVVNKNDKREVKEKADES